MKYERLTDSKNYSLLTKQELFSRLHRLETKIENGTLIEVDVGLIGECVIGIHKYTDDTYSLDLDENLVIGFATDGIVTWNNTHKYNDYFSNGLYFIDNEKGRVEAEKLLDELQNKQKMVEER